MVVAAVAIAAAEPWWPRVGEPSTWATSDHQILWAAATALDEGLDPFDTDVLDIVGRRAGREATPFSASQPLAVALVGLASDDDYAASYRRWRALNAVWLAATLAACAWLVAHLARARGPGALGPLPAAVAILGLSEATSMSLWFNSWNPAAATALLAAAAAWRRFPVAAGVALGAAVLVKTSPALVVAFAAAAGAWRAVGAAAATWGALTALGVAWLGVDVHVAWFSRVLPRLGFASVSEGDFNNALHLWNLAPNGLVTRAAFSGGALDAAAWIAPAVAVVLAGVALGVVVAARRRGRAAGAWVVAVGVATSLLVSSVTWPHHLIFGSVAWAWWIATVPRAGLVPRLLGLFALVVLVVPLGLWGDAEFDARLRTAGLVALWGAVLSTPPRPDEIVGCTAPARATELPTG